MVDKHDDVYLPVHLPIFIRLKSELEKKKEKSEINPIQKALYAGDSINKETVLHYITHQPKHDIKN